MNKIKHKTNRVISAAVAMVTALVISMTWIIPANASDNYITLESGAATFYIEEGISEEALLTVYNTYYSLPQEYRDLLEYNNPYSKVSCTKIYIVSDNNKTLEFLEADGLYTGGGENVILVKGTKSTKRITYITYHELGHAITMNTDIYSDEYLEYLYQTEYVTKYGTTSKLEFFAEAYALYMTDPDELAERTPLTYEYIDVYVPVYVHSMIETLDAHAAEGMMYDDPSGLSEIDWG